MADREKKQGDGEEDSDEKNHPLSREGWINLLTGEINKEEMKLPTYWNSGLIILIALFSAAVGALVVSLQSDVTSIEDKVYTTNLALALLICWIVIPIIYVTRYRSPYQKRLEALMNTREKIISGKIDFSEIHREWEQYMKNYYGRYLKYPEMNEAKKELSERKENHEEKDSRKSINEQKESLQIIQSDIRDTKECLHKIESINEVSRFFSQWCIFGSLCITIGFAMIGIRISLGYTNLSKIEIFSFLLIFAGAFMLSGAFIAGTNVNSYKKPWKNKLLFLGILSFVCALGFFLSNTLLSLF